MRALSAARRLDAPPRDAGPLRPPLKWAGGKRWQLPHLAPIWERHSRRRLVEPFCGGLGVALGLRPARALLADVNPHLINFYRCLQRGEPIEVRGENERESFDRSRARFNDLIRAGEAEGPEAAALFFYLNRTGFNGLCRFNSKGLFNVPFGRYATIRYELPEASYAEAMARWSFACGDFERLSVEPGDFVYADPPYDVPFTSYSAGGFSWEDQERLVRWLDRHDGPTVLVNQATDRVVDLYERHGFRLERLEAPRRISCTGDRTAARELFATRGL